MLSSYQRRGARARALGPWLGLSPFSQGTTSRAPGLFPPRYFPPQVADQPPDSASFETLPVK